MRMYRDHRSALANGNRIGIVGHADQANAIACLHLRNRIFAKHSSVEMPEIDFIVRGWTNGLPPGEVQSFCFAIASTISLQDMGLRAFFRTAKAASICDIFLSAVLVAAGFFAEAFLAGAVLVVLVVFFAAMFVFPFVWGSRCSALASVANGTTQLPLVRKHIQLVPPTIWEDFRVENALRLWFKRFGKER